MHYSVLSHGQKLILVFVLYTFYEGIAPEVKKPKNSIWPNYDEKNIFEQR